MQPVIQSFKKYLATIIISFIYLLLWWNQWNVRSRFDRQSNQLNNGERITWGEGIIYGEFFTLITGAGLAVLLLMLSIVYKEKRRVYLILSALLILQVGIFIYLKTMA